MFNISQFLHNVTQEIEILLFSKSFIWTVVEWEKWRSGENIHKGRSDTFTRNIHGKPTETLVNQLQATCPRLSLKGTVCKISSDP